MQPLSKLNQKLITHPVRNLFFVWLVCLSVLAILQALKLGFGYQVWPMGEDRNWLGFMLTNNGKQMIHAYWAVNDRNPLSAWWWFPVAKLLKFSDYALYAIRKCVDPFVAIVTYLLLDQLGKGKNRFFAFSVGLIVLLWNFSAYFEQIIWEFIVAIGFNLLSIYFYCRYVDKNKSPGNDLAAALLCYLIAIATYTLQSGAILAIPFIAFFRGQTNFLNNFFARIKSTIADSSLFAGILIIYYCIWFTASRNADVFYVFDWSIFLDHVGKSLQAFIYHSSYSMLWQFVINDWSKETIVISMIAVFCSVFWLLSKVARSVDNHITAPFGWTILVLLAIATPTVIVESTSNIWTPATRSLMVQQVWQPILYLTFLFFIFQLIPNRFNKFKNYFIVGIIALVAATTQIVALNYNHHLVLRTHYQRVLAHGIKKLNDKTPTPIYMVKIVNPTLDTFTIPVSISTYGQTMLHDLNVSLRIIATNPNLQMEPYWKVVFGTDKEGVKNAKMVGDTVTRSYKQILIVFFDGKKVWVPEVINKEDFDGYQISWERSQPILQKS